MLDLLLNCGANLFARNYETGKTPWEVLSHTTPDCNIDQATVRGFLGRDQLENFDVFPQTYVWGLGISNSGGYCLVDDVAVSVPPEKDSVWLAIEENNVGAQCHSPYVYVFKLTCPRINTLP